MNEQFYIDWINSLDIPNSAFIDKIVDLYSNNNILLNIISKILNKSIDELTTILGKSKSINILENISNLMNLYFDYNYDYSNDKNLNKNTLSLLKFLKSRYPKETKETKIKNKYENNKINAKNDINAEDRYSSFNNKNFNLNKKRINSNINFNKIKKNYDFQLNSDINLNSKDKNERKTFFNFPKYNYFSNPNRCLTSGSNKKLNKTNNNYFKYNNLNNNYLSNNQIKNSNLPKKINSSFAQNIPNFQLKQNLKSKSINSTQYISKKELPQSQNMKYHKSSSSNNLNKKKKMINFENFDNSSDIFVNKIMAPKVPNYYLMTIGKPILKKDDYLYYYQFPKFSCPVTKLNIDQDKKPDKTCRNNYYKFPYLLQNLINQKNNEKSFNDKLNDKNNSKLNNSHINIDIGNIQGKEKLILDYLNKMGIINAEQKNLNYLWKVLIPDLKDGYIVGKLINLLENKKNNYLKGITKETFYKVNIHYNWQKIIEFLINKNYFNSIYLYQKNFYDNDKKLFDFLYDLLYFYYEKENMNRNTFNYFKQKTNNISRIKNTSNHHLIDDNNSEFSKNNSNINRSLQNKSFYSLPIERYNINKNDKFLKNIKNRPTTGLKMSNIPSISEIMNIRKGINYIHRENKSLISFPNKDGLSFNKDKSNLNNSEGYINLKKKDIFYTKGENNSFDAKVNNIISFLNLIGINTTNINFYLPEMKIFKDGILLYQIITQLESNSTILPKIDLNPKNPSTAINNHRNIINFLQKYKKNFPVELTGKERELYLASPKFILKFLLVLKSIYNNEVYYYEKINKKNKDDENNINIGKNMKINPKNIDKSERIALPLSQELRNKFLVNDNAKIWA